MDAEQSLVAEDVKLMLGLQPHPREGGWYVRTYEPSEQLAPAQFSDMRYATPRLTSTAIYYLLEPGTFSEMHLLQSDEIFHHYLGGPVEMLQLLSDGQSRRILIGGNLATGERPQVIVPRGVWQGSRLLHDTGWALLGCTVSPGFEFEDYESGQRDELTARWPAEADLITQLTHG